MKILVIGGTGKVGTEVVPGAASPWRVCPRPDSEQGVKAARRCRDGHRRPAKTPTQSVMMPSSNG
jgi:hypothetical protein